MDAVNEAAIKVTQELLEGTGRVPVGSEIDNMSARIIADIGALRGWYRAKPSEELDLLEAFNKAYNEDPTVDLKVAATASIFIKRLQNAVQFTSTSVAEMTQGFGASYAMRFAADLGFNMVDLAIYGMVAVTWGAALDAYKNYINGEAIRSDAEFYEKSNEVVKAARLNIADLRVEAFRQEGPLNQETTMRKIFNFRRLLRSFREHQNRYIFNMQATNPKIIQAVRALRDENHRILRQAQENFPDAILSPPSLIGTNETAVCIVSDTAPFISNAANLAKASDYFVENVCVRRLHFPSAHVWSHGVRLFVVDSQWTGSSVSLWKYADRRSLPETGRSSGPSNARMAVRGGHDGVA
jgi:hypothetical protein